MFAYRSVQWTAAGTCGQQGLAPNGNMGRKALENSLNTRLSAATPSLALSAMASRTTSLGSRPTLVKCVSALSRSANRSAGQSPIVPSVHQRPPTFCVQRVDRAGKSEGLTSFERLARPRPALSQVLSASAKVRVPLVYYLANRNCPIRRVDPKRRCRKKQASGGEGRKAGCK